MPKPFELIVFDWDGTLMDSTAIIASSIQYACRDLGLTVPSDESASYVIGLGLNDALAHAAPELTPEMLPRMLERYRHHYMSRDPHLELFPEVPEMIAELRATGYRLAVATGKSRVGLNRALAACGLEAAFDATRCADESISKPDPAMLLELTNRLGVPVGQTLMIGDTTHDLQMAINAGTHGLGVGYGAHPEAALQALAPLACVDSVTSLRRWLRDFA